MRPYQSIGQAILYLIVGLVLAVYLFKNGKWREAILVICFVATLGALLRWLSR